jgi:hypothetical protein
VQCTTSVLIDDGDDGETPRLLFTLEHVVHDGRKGRHGAYNVASQRLEFVGGQVEQIRVGSGSINADGGVSLVMARFGNDVTPPGRMPGENAMKANERMARRGYERRQARKQLDGLHHAMGLATPPRALELVGDAAVTEHGQALEAERGAHAVAEESLTSNAIVGFDSNARVQIEAERLKCDRTSPAHGAVKQRARAIRALGSGRCDG